MSDGHGARTAERVVRLDFAEVAARATVAAGSAGGGTVQDLHALNGGLSSVTLSGRWIRDNGESERIVVKIAPPGLNPVGNRDVLRQARLLRSLRVVDGVAVPEVVFTDEGEPPGVPPLFAMRFVDGDSFEPVNDHHPLPPPETLTSRALQAAAMLARMHAAPLDSLGLKDEPAVGLDAEIERWERALDTVDADLCPGHAECAAALRAATPDAVGPTVCHGDWRLGNMLCDGGSVSAVIDWEIWSVSDPRVDLAWFLACSTSEGNVFAVREAPGMPCRARLLAVYEDALHGSAGDLSWFDALVEFKQAAAMGLILKHNRRRERPDSTVEAHAPRLPRLIERATARVFGGIR